MFLRWMTILRNQFLDNSSGPIQMEAQNHVEYVFSQKKVTVFDRGDWQARRLMKIVSNHFESIFSRLKILFHQTDVVLIAYTNTIVWNRSDGISSPSVDPDDFVTNYLKSSRRNFFDSKILVWLTRALHKAQFVS